ncbi:MAG: DUF1573 domain-containing protein [Planctomycetaceae bacterium]|nr:DUF1573 domain-containing protein [Planctomycetaceae bacterium]
MTVPSDASARSPAGISSAPPVNAVLTVPRWVRSALCAATLVPFAGALAASGLPLRPALIAPGSSANSLAFEQYQVNLGPIPPMPEVTARYTFRNVGQHPIHVTELQPSCGCLNPRLEKRDYAPGETGSFHLRVQTASQNTGPQDFTVRVKFEERPQGATPVEQPPVELAFKMILPEKQVSIRPRALAFYQLGTEPTTQEVAIVDDRGQGLKIVDVKTSSPFIEAEVARSETREKLTEHTLKVTVAGTVPPGRTRALINVRTNDPTYKVLQVPILIQGPEKPTFTAEANLKVDPAQITFPAASGLIIEPKEVTVTGQAGQPLVVLGAKSSTGMVEATVLDSTHDLDGRPVVKLQVHLVAGSDNKSVRDVVNIRTNDPGQPQVQIPVVISSPIQQTSAKGTELR